MSATILSTSPPKAPPIKYHAPLGTRWEKEKAAAGGAAAFDLPSDPKNIGPWILGECVGKGASGRVKIAKHCHTGQLAAVKILPVAPLANSRASMNIDPAKAEKQRLGIDREITMMKLMNHPNIMHIYDVYEGERELFLVLEYIEGGELFDFLVNRGRLPPAEALVYFKQIVYGLNYAHTFSIIHRDLKPENILIASLSPPLVKIADWGMAAFAPPYLQLETSCGSPHYASPEIVNGEKYSGNATDIWSCGVILFALLTGRLPFDDKNVRTLLGKVKLGKYDLPSYVDPLAQDLIRKMLVVDVSSRITIPEILSHPWLRLGGLSGTSLTSSPTVCQNPSLPPSPSTLAQPITAGCIDPELFASLRIIWGRHSDPLGEIIRRELNSPEGQGTHAKAFYFLLMQYREETMKARAAVGGWRDLNRSHGPPALESMKFDKDWKLMDMSSTQQGDDKMIVDSPRRSSVCRPRLPPLTLVAPQMSRPNSASSRRRSREAPPSPVGPRPLSTLSSARPRSVFPADDVPRPFSGYHVVRRKSNPSPTPSPSFGNSSTQTKAVPRPGAPKRGCTYHGSNGHQHGADGRLDFQILARRKSTAIPSSQEQVEPSRSRRPSSSLAAPRYNARRTSRQASPEVPHLPPLTLDDQSVVSGTSDVLFSASSPQVDASVMPISPVSMVAPAVENAMTVDLASAPQDAAERDGAPSKAQKVLGERITRRRAATSKSELDNKENVISEGQRAAVPERTTIGLGVGRGLVGREMGNVIRIGEVPENRKKSGREPRARSQTVDHASLKHKRSTIGAWGSPAPISPAPYGPSSKPTTPVVDEFKGWISNLFGRSSNYGCLYSPLDVAGVQRIVESVLREKNVTIETSNFADQVVLRCAIEQVLDRYTILSLKPVRFRIELLPAAASAMSTSASDDFSPRPLGSPFQTPSIGEAPSHPQPRDSFSVSKSSHPISAPINGGNTRMEIPPGTFSAVIMIKDKGSSTSFNTVWQGIKDNLGNFSVAEPSCKSPTAGSTPISEGPTFMAAV